MRFLTKRFPAFGVLIFFFSLQSYAQRGMPAKEIVPLTATTNYAQHVDFKESMLSQLKVPAGFTVGIAATGLGKPRMMAVGSDGALYVTRRDAGDVLMLKDTDGDGRMEELKTVVSQFSGVHGIALKDGWMYLISNRILQRGKLMPDGMVGKLDTLIKDLPDAGQHPNRTIAFGPDGKLYISVGSTCNDCRDANPENSTLLQVEPNAWSRRIYARGLRNTIGFEWHPQTGELWGADQGRDYLGDEVPPEELNRIKDSADYGFPIAYGERVIDQTREDPMGTTKEEYAAKTEPSMLGFPAHSAAMNLVFLNRLKGAPADYADDAIVSMHGSWNKKNPDGFKVLRVKFENGKPAGYEDFLTGFYNAGNRTRFGRPCGLVIGQNGVLYLSDDANGVIYSITASNGLSSTK